MDNLENTEYFQTQIKLAENIVKLDDEDIKKTWYSRRPAKLLNYLYLGDCSDANSIGMLTEMGITHALNCAGAERSATVCIAYLIARKRMTFLDAVKAVQEKRIKILTNKGFLKQLANFAKVHGLL